MTCALVIGGEKWLNKVYSNFRTQPRLGSTTMFELYEDAIASGEEHAKYLAGIRHRSLDQQLEKFRAEGVAF